MRILCLFTFPEVWKVASSEEHTHQVIIVFINSLLQLRSRNSTSGMMSGSKAWTSCTLYAPKRSRFCKMFTTLLWGTTSWLPRTALKSINSLLTHTRPTSSITAPTLPVFLSFTYQPVMLLTSGGCRPYSCEVSLNCKWRFRFMKPEDTLCFILDSRPFDTDDCSATKVVQRLYNCPVKYSEFWPTLCYKPYVSI
jgi:hypothetical protein